jgi:hypothetical protein
VSTLLERISRRSSQLEMKMELIHKEGFVKVYACKIDEHVLIWQADYPTRANLIATCDSMEEALEWAKDYSKCINEGVAF